MQRELANERKIRTETKIIKSYYYNKSVQVEWNTSIDQKDKLRDIDFPYIKGFFNK